VRVLLTFCCPVAGEADRDAPKRKNGADMPPQISGSRRPKERTKLCSFTEIQFLRFSTVYITKHDGTKKRAFLTNNDKSMDNILSPFWFTSPTRSG
jgi:hypothetical protein